MDNKELAQFIRHLPEMDTDQLLDFLGNGTRQTIAMIEQTQPPENLRNWHHAWDIAQCHYSWLCKHEMEQLEQS